MDVENNSSRQVILCLVLFTVRYICVYQSLLREKLEVKPLKEVAH